MARQLASAVPHYFVVVNVRPLEDRVLVLAVITSQVDKVRHRRAALPGTTVPLCPADYPELSQPSMGNGNSVFRKSLAELVKKIKRGEVRYKPDIPGTLLQAIQAAIPASPLVEEETKGWLAPNPS